MKTELNSGYDKVNIDGLTIFIDNASMSRFKTKDEVDSFTIPLQGDVVKISSGLEIALNNLKSFKKEREGEIKAIVFDEFSFDEARGLYILKKDCCSLEMRSLLVMFKNNNKYIVTGDQGKISEVITNNHEANMVILNDIDVKTMVKLTEMGRISILNITFDIVK